MWHELLERSLIFVTGKGGTGKTTLSYILGSILAKEGKKKTLFTITSDNLSKIQILPDFTFSHKIKKIEGTLYGVCIDTVESSKEFVSMVLGNRTIPRLLFSDKLGIKTILRIIPALKEWAIIGKLTHHIEKGDFDTIVVDSPSTGHFIDLIRVSEVVLKTTPPSLMHSLALTKTELLKSQKSSIVVVTIPESLAVNETVMLIDLLKREKFHVEGIVINKVEPPLLSQSNSIDETIIEECPSLREFIITRKKKEEREKQNIKRIEALGYPILPLPYFISEDLHERVNLLYSILKGYLFLSCVN